MIIKYFDQLNDNFIYQYVHFILSEHDNDVSIHNNVEMIHNKTLRVKIGANNIE